MALDANYLVSFKIVYGEEGAKQLQQTHQEYINAIKNKAQLAEKYEAQRTKLAETYQRKEANIVSQYQASRAKAMEAAAQKSLNIAKWEADARLKYRRQHFNSEKGFEKSAAGQLIAIQEAAAQRGLQARLKAIGTKETAALAKNQRALEAGLKGTATAFTPLFAEADKRIANVEKGISRVVGQGQKLRNLQMGAPIGQFTLFLERFQQVFRRVFDALGAFVILNAISAAFTGFIRSVYNANVALEGLNARLRTVIRGKDSIASVRAEILRLTVLTPFVIKDFVDATVTLEAFGLRAVKYLKPIADWAAAIGRDVTDVALAFAKVSVYSPRTALLLTTRGISKRDFDIELKKTRDAAEALNNIIRRNFGDTAIYMSRTFAGLVSNISDSWVQLADVFGEPAFQHLKRIVITVYQFLTGGEAQKSAAMLAGALKTVLYALEAISLLVGVTLIKQAGVWLGSMLKGAAQWLTLNKRMGLLISIFSKPLPFFALVMGGAAIADMVWNVTTLTEAMKGMHEAAQRKDLPRYLEMVDLQIAMIQERMLSWEWALLRIIRLSFEPFLIPKAIIESGGDWEKTIQYLENAWYRELEVLKKRSAELEKQKNLALEFKRITTTPLPATGAEAALEIRKKAEGDTHGIEKLKKMLALAQEIANLEAKRPYTAVPAHGVPDWLSKYLGGGKTALPPLREEEADLVRQAEAAMALGDQPQLEKVIKKLTPVMVKTAKEAVKVLTMAVMYSETELQKMALQELYDAVNSPEYKAKLRDIFDVGGTAFDEWVNTWFSVSTGGKTTKALKDYTDELAEASAKMRELLGDESVDYARAAGYFDKYQARYKIYEGIVKESGKTSEKAHEAELNMMDSFNQWLETRARIDLRIADLEDRQAETQRGMVEAQVNLNKARAEYGYLITRDVGITKKQLENDKARFEVQYATISAQIASKELLQKDAAQLKSREEYLKGEAELNNLYKERFDTLAAIYQIMIEIFNLPSLTWAQAFNKELLNWKDNLNKFYDDMVSTVMVGLKDVVVESINDLIFGVDEATSQVDEYRRELEGVYLERAREMAMLNKYRRREDETTEAYAERLFLVEEENRMATVQYEYKTKELEILEKINQEEAKRNSLILQRFKGLGSKIFDKLLDYGIQALANWAFGGGTTGGATGEATAYRAGVELPPLSPSGRTININVTGNTVYGSNDFEKMVDDAVGKYARYRTA